MVPTPTVDDLVIQALEDERTVSYVPLLVLSEEVFYSPLSLWERAGVRDFF
jgi:hypothetical protein